MKNYEGAKEYILGKLKRELPTDLYYHGLHHTMDVLQSAKMIGESEGISDDDLVLLKTAVLYHDSGFTRTYRNHEEVGCEMAREDLPKFGYNPVEIERICGMIMATKIPQSPKNQLEYIIADADLEYLGTDRFDQIGRTLYEEMKLYVNLESERQWNIIQMNFLRNHQYFTQFCKDNREATKQANLEQVIKIVETYD